MLSSKLPLSSKDLVRFTPERYRKPEAKEAAEKAVLDAMARLEAGGGGAGGEGADKPRLARHLAFLEADLKRFEAPPVYLLRVPTLQARAAYNRDLASEGADYPGDGEFLAALEAAVKALIEDEAERADIVAAIETQRSEAKTEATAEIVNRAMDLLAPHDARIRALRARRAFWFEVAPVLAARHFLYGAEIGAAEPLLVKRGLGGLASEAALIEHFPPGDVVACGWHAMTLTEIDRPTAKN